MAMPDSKYWIKRFETLEDAHNGYGLETYKKIEPAFNKAQANIQKEIESWYARYAKNNNISTIEARKHLISAELKELKWNIEEYIRYGKENASSFDGKWMKELENASAKYHISRLEALKLNIQQQAEVAFGNELDTLDSMMRSMYQDGYYRTIYEVQKGIGLGWGIGSVDNKKLASVITKPWSADGKNFSSRIWVTKTQMVSELHQELARTLAQGKSADEAIKSLTTYLKDKTRNAKYKAGRLVMTEQAFISSVAQRDAFKELDVEEFEVFATLDSKTSKICQDMDGRHYPMSQYEVGVTAPPFHPWCRSTTVPYFDDEWGRSGERVARDADGSTYYVPSDMKYSEWKEKFVDNTRENVIIKSAKENGINGVVNVEPKPLNLEKYVFDDAHINAQREHNVTREEAEQFIKDAAVSFTRWNGRFINFYGENGAVYIDTEKKVIKTAFKKEEFDDKINSFMKVVLNYGR